MAGAVDRWRRRFEEGRVVRRRGSAADHEWWSVAVRPVPVAGEMDLLFSGDGWRWQATGTRKKRWRVAAAGD
jgi:hypothetical protein